MTSPFVTREGADFVTTHLSSEFRTAGRLAFLTDLSPLNICMKSTDPSALRLLAEAVPAWDLSHLPRLHAKVYIADRDCAIITSGNLTAGGLTLNYEYGVELSDPAVVALIRQDIQDYAGLGAAVDYDQLLAYCQTAEQVRRAYEGQLRSAAKAARREFKRTFQEAEEDLIRLRLAGGAITAVFEKTIVYLLRRHGPLSTQQLHPLVQAIHPDLCDDTVDRVINGQHYGKKWKHVVRRAQSHLKDRGVIEFQAGVWRLATAQAP